MYVDSHCHLDFPELAESIDAVLARMQQQRVQTALCVSVTLEDFPGVLALAQSDPRLWASVGVHPDYPDCTEPTVEQLLELSQHPRVVAIGETGLDYFRITEDAPWQRERVRVHIRAAGEAGLPLIIHSRAASADPLRLMQEEKASECGGVMHCFTEDWATASAALDMGFFISFSGIVTFKNARQVHEVARRVPMERLLIETDSPYLAPVPHRGKTNEPGYVPHVAARIAELKSIDVGEVARISTENFFSLFSKSRRPDQGETR